MFTLNFLNYTGAEPLSIYSGHFRMGTGPILYAYLNCDGTESTLAECSTYGSFYFAASHSRDAGVKCQRTPGIISISQLALHVLYYR